jgi:hypothetical protein
VGGGAVSENKRIRKKILGHRKQIEKHRRKIARELEQRFPDRRGIDTWEKHIAIHEREIAKLEEKLPGGKT